MRFSILGRRAQIRGIDFSLAMIIFSVTMTQVLILTSTFIEGNRTFISFEEREAKAEGLASEIAFSPGISGGTTSWELSSTATLIGSNWTFGMSDYGKLNPFKAARLSNWSVSDWELDYDIIKASTSTTNDFKIQIVSPLKIEILSINDDNANSILIDGTVTRFNKPIGGAKISGFAVNATQDVAQGYTVSNSVGNFSVNVSYNFALEINDYYSIVVFAEFGSNTQDIVISNHLRGIGSLPANIGRISLSNSSDFTEGYAVNVTTEFDVTISSASVLALFPGYLSGQLNHSTGVLEKVSGANIWTIDDLKSPFTGSVLYLAMGFQGVVLDSIAYLNFPVTLDDEFSKAIEPRLTIQSSSSTGVLIIEVRGLILLLLVTIWG